MFRHCRKPSGFFSATHLKGNRVCFCMDTTFISVRDALRTMRPLKEEVQELRQELAVIKRILSEGKLTPWAKKELAQARKQPRSSYVSLDDI